MGILKEILFEYIDYFKATFARCMFLMHATIVIWRTVVLLGTTYWLIAIGVVCLFIEYFVTLIVRNGQEWNWFSPATLCYLISALPGLWLQKLYHLGHYGNIASTSVATVPSTSVTLDFSQEDWMLLSEQTMMVTIILSRWLLPKGQMTHNEVSQLLLLYLSLSSDIIDFLSIFSFTAVANDEAYCYVLLFWWTWAMLQFTLVLTSTHDTDTDNDAGNKDNNKPGDIESGKETTTTTGDTENSGNREEEEDEITAEDGEEGNGTKGGTAEGGGEQGGGKETEKESAVKSLKLREVLCSSELWAILVVFFLQDGPFLANRLVVMLYFKVFNYTIIFFICKNLLVLALQTYRVIVLFMESRAKVKESKVKAKAAMLARRYSTISLYSFGSTSTVRENDSDDDSDDDGDNRGGRKVISSSVDSRDALKGNVFVVSETATQAGSSMSAAYDPPPSSSAFAGMPTVGRKNLPPILSLLAASNKSRGRSQPSPSWAKVPSKSQGGPPERDSDPHNNEEGARNSAVEEKAAGHAPVRSIHIAPGVAIAVQPPRTNDPTAPGARRKFLKKVASEGALPTVKESSSPGLGRRSLDMSKRTAAKTSVPAHRTFSAWLSGTTSSRDTASRMSLQQQRKSAMERFLMESCHPLQAEKEAFSWAKPSSSDASGPRSGEDVGGPSRAGQVSQQPASPSSRQAPPLSMMSRSGRHTDHGLQF
ncbi:uncharacterized protein LOC143284980 [Babylonia areolata]|uniref:uncharacterized protein LOC143284980 n=1 Tax=Babylonia areolata TaxID=304850 RepID=UPI003FD0D24E